jgi:uncharacterized membrane protein
MMQQTVMAGWTRRLVITVDRFAFRISGHWLALFVVAFGVLVLAPFLAPALMKAGATGPANIIYGFYSLLCHQLPQRSLFLFGSQPMYSLTEIKAVWPLDGFLGLRQFVGNPEMGYKVAWSERMIALYGSVWLGAMGFALVRARLKSLPLVAWLLVGVLPVGLDGLIHMVNDAVAGTSGAGFRDNNAWLQALTRKQLPPWFYAGDALGSFNSDVRWLTGILFGLTTVWLLFPMLEAAMRDLQAQTARQLERACRS